MPRTADPKPPRPVARRPHPWIRGASLISFILALAVAITFYMRICDRDLTLLAVYVALVLAAAACVDAARGVIPNSLTYAAAIASLGLLMISSAPPAPGDRCGEDGSTKIPLHACHEQHNQEDPRTQEATGDARLIDWLAGPGRVRGLVGMVIVSASALLLFFGGAWGGGDAKLVIAIAPCLGMEFMIGTLVLALALSLVLAGANCCTRGAFLRVIPALVHRLCPRLRTPSTAFQFPKGRVPFAPPLFTAYVVVLCCDLPTFA